MSSEPGQSHPAADAWSEHHASLLAFLRGLLGDEHAAADCLQQTFATFIETGGPPVAGNLRGWLFQVSRNYARQYQRRKVVEKKGMAKLASGSIRPEWALVGQASSVEETLEKQERFETIRNLVQQLPNEDLRLLKMRMDEGLTFAEIARRLEMPIGTVLTRVRRTLAGLRKTLIEADSEK